ncbi:MAG TPA: ABC transporter permease [Candidatus Paceibacterota bacterium]
MYPTYKLTVAAAKMFVRSRQAFFFTLAFPIIIMLIFGYIGFDKPATIDIGLTAANPTPQTQAFITQIEKFPTFKVHEGALADELAALNNGDRSVVLEVPNSLVPVAGKQPQVVAHINESKQAEAQTVVTILNQFATQATLQSLHAQPLFAIDSQIVNSKNLRYIDFLIPGLIALSVMQMSVFSVAFVFVQYKEKGVLKRLLATPMRPWQFIVANTIVRLSIAVFQAAVFIVMGLILFHVHIYGAWWLLALSILLGATMFLGLGFTVSGLAKTVDTVPVFANLVVFPMMFLGGTFFAISNMPTWLQAVAKFLPLTFFSTAVRSVMTDGATFFDIKWDLLGMLVWAVILVTLATVTFSFQEKEGA